MCEYSSGSMAGWWLVVHMVAAVVVVGGMCVHVVGVEVVGWWWCICGLGSCRDGFVVYEYG